nr:hypothetical protein [uncultured Sphingomonas sp.]
MGPAFYVIAIMGCADGSSACTPVATVPTRYESLEACVAASNDALMTSGDFDFPTVIAKCRAGSAPAAEKIPAKTPTAPVRQG